jgi:hypothetical protein
VPFSGNPAEEGIAPANRSWMGSGEARDPSRGLGFRKTRTAFRLGLRYVTAHPRGAFNAGPVPRFGYSSPGSSLRRRRSHSRVTGLDWTNPRTWG